MTDKAKQMRPLVTVGAVILNDKKEVLMIASKKHFGKYALPAGHVEYGERLEDAVRREVQEETGLSIKGVTLLRVAESIKSDDYVDNTKHFVSINFIGYTNDDTVVLDESEASSYKWMLPSEILKLEIDILTRGSIEEMVKREV